MVTCVERNRNLIVKVSGEIDHHSADEIREAVEREFSKARAKNVIFDFAGVTFMDSSGIGMLIGRYKAVERLGGKVYAININVALNRIFEISGLKKIIGCLNSIDEAV